MAARAPRLHTGLSRRLASSITIPANRVTGGLRSSEPVVSEERRIRDVLDALRQGIPPDADGFEHVLGALRRLARKFMSHQHGPHLLQTTALMNEAYIRLFDRTDPQWNDSAHFFNSASTVMHCIVVDHARRLLASKRSVGAVVAPGTQYEVDLSGNDPCFDIVAIDDCLALLAETDPDMASIVRLHVFGGRTLCEVAEILGTSKRTVEREWRMARALLRTQLRRG